MNPAENSRNCRLLIPDKNSIGDPGRRKFLTQVGMFLGGLTIVGTAASILESCATGSNPVRLQPGNTAASITINVATLTSNGQALVTSDVGPDGAPIIVYRQSAGVFQAHSMLCTHAGCPLDAPSGSKMVCNCHGSIFDLQGNVLQGPAQYPLTAYPTTFDATSNHLTIKFR